MKKLILAVVLAGLAAVGLGGCVNDATVATDNIKQAANNFKIYRRIVVMNNWTDSYVFQVEGYCSQENQGGQLAVICKLSNGQFVRHIAGLSQNVSFLSEQMQPSAVSGRQYNIVFKPSVIIPTVELR